MQGIPTIHISFLQAGIGLAGILLWICLQFVFLIRRAAHTSTAERRRMLKQTYLPHSFLSNMEIVSTEGYFKLPKAQISIFWQVGVVVSVIMVDPSK